MTTAVRPWFRVSSYTLSRSGRRREESDSTYSKPISLLLSLMVRTPQSLLINAHSTSSSGLLIASMDTRLIITSSSISTLTPLAVRWHDMKLGINNSFMT